MKVIHKIALDPGMRTYNLPAGSVLLTAQFQGSDLMLWYMRPAKSLYYDEHQLLYMVTGQPFDDGKYKHIATAQKDGFFVAHVLEWLP